MVWLYEQWLVSYTHTGTHTAGTHAHTSLLKTHARPQGPWKQRRGDVTPFLLSLCLSMRWPYMTGATGLCMFSTKGWHVSCPHTIRVKCEKRRLCVCECASILHLSLFDRNAAASTLTSQHTLSRQCVCQRHREMECVYVRAVDKGGKGGGLLRNLRKKGKEEGKAEGEREIDMEGDWGVTSQRR